MKGIFSLFCAFVLSLTLFTNAFAASDYPNKPINMIIAFSAGGSSDVQARLMQKYWEKANEKARWVFVYKAGAGGAIGFREIANARKDAYTIGGINVPHMLIQPLIQDTGFTTDSFEFICQVVNDPQLVVVKKGSPFTTIEAFFAHVKANPNTIKVGLVGPNSGHQIMLMDIKSKIDFPIIPVYYKGAADQNVALLSGEVDAMLGNLNDAMRSLEEMNVLAIAAEKRNDFIPEVATLREKGYDIVSDIRRAFVAPKGIAPEQLAELRRLFKAIATNPEYLAEMKKIGQPAEYMDGPEFLEYVKAQNIHVQETLVKTGAIKPAQ